MNQTIIPVLLPFLLAIGCARDDSGASPTARRATRPTAAKTTATKAQRTANGNVDLPRYPSISPNGSEIVFSWRGDLWKVVSAGGMARRLTTHPGDDLRSAWSSDGATIVFDSNRSGYRNIHLMNADGTGLRAVTDTDASCTLVAYGTDSDGGTIVTFDTRIEDDLYRSPRPYKISTRGGDMLRVHNAFGAHAAPSSDGKRILFTRGGSSWMRRHYMGPDDRDVWLYTPESDSFRQLTEYEGNDGQARWAGGDSMIFLSDREFDCVNVYRTTIKDGGSKAERLTAFKDVDVQYLNVSADGRTAVFTAWDKLYTLALDQDGATPALVRVTANEDEKDNYLIKSIDRTVSEATLSPDGKVMAYVAYGEIYIRNMDKKSIAARVTNDHARERQIAWSPDGLKLYFVSDRSGSDSIYAATVTLTRGEIKDDFKKATSPEEEEEEEEEADDEDEADDGEEEDEEEDDSDDAKDEDAEKKDDEKKDKKDKDEDLPKELQSKRWHDALKFTIEPVVNSDANERNPSPSPDGKSLAYRHGRGDLHVLDFESGETRTLAEGWDFGIEWRWSPDSRYIAYEQSDLNFNTDIWIAVADGSSPAVNITRHPDNDGSARWSADGKILSFVSERVNEEFDLWMVYLDQELEAYTPKELADYYDKRVKAVKKLKPLKVEKPKSDDDEASATQPTTDEAEKKEEKKKKEP
ncbi:MAG: PD40 domain-containing protein, partial [Armatimonadetes bacterium]|nr:PD40 domain-containing protein [Armatimonadota bacterium]